MKTSLLGIASLSEMADDGDHLEIIKERIGLDADGSQNYSSARLSAMVAAPLIPR